MATLRRQEKMESLLCRLVSEFFCRLNFKKHIVSVTRAKITENLKFAKIYVSIYPEKEARKIFEEIRSKTGEIKKYLATQLKNKFMPEVEFEMDESEKNRQKIEEILKTAR